MILSMHLALHFVITALAIMVVWGFTNSPAAAFACFLGGVLIDIDHFIDYFAYYGAKINSKGFLYRYFLKSGNVYIPLHSWELIAPIWFLSRCFGCGVWTSAFIMGFIPHLLTDIFINNSAMSVYTYFFSYRLFHRFRLERISPEMFINENRRLADITE